MRVVIFSGTTEGRRLSRALAALGAAVTVCVATEYGRVEQGMAPGVAVLSGRQDVPEMAALLQNAALCIDATHPYATAATANIRAACAASAVPYKRLLRAASPLPPDAVVVDCAASACAFLAGTAGSILLTTGAKELAAFAPLGAARLYPRVLPLPASLAACAAAGIPPSNILALQGPFTQALNRAMIDQYQIAWLVTKDGGRVGGFAEKADAARAAGAGLVVIRRPADSGQSYNEILRECKELMGCR